MRKALRLLRRRQVTEKTFVFVLNPADMECVTLGPPELSFAEAGAPDIRRAPLRYSSSESNADISLRGGAHCFVGRIDGSIVFHMWAFSLDEQAVTRLLPEADWRGPAIFVHDCVTRPEFRGRSVYPAALRWLAMMGRERGDPPIVLTVTERNEAALRAVQKAGGRFAGIVPIESEAKQSTRAIPVAALVQILREALRVREEVWVAGTGESMAPTIHSGEAVLIGRVTDVRRADIVLVARDGSVLIHRVVATTPDAVCCRGDAADVADGWFSRAAVVGRAVAVAARREGNTAAPGMFRLLGAVDLHRNAWRVHPLTPSLRFGIASLARHYVRRLMLIGARMRRARSKITRLRLRLLDAIG